MTGPVEIALIAGVIFLIFGAKKIPDFARSLGKAKTEFRKGIDEGEEAAEEQAAEEAAEEGSRT